MRRLVIRASTVLIGTAGVGILGFGLRAAAGPQGQAQSQQPLQGKAEQTENVPVGTDYFAANGGCGSAVAGEHDGEPACRWLKQSLGGGGRDATCLEALGRLIEARHTFDQAWNRMVKTGTGMPPVEFQRLSHEYTEALVPLDQRWYGIGPYVGQACWPVRPAPPGCPACRAMAIGANYRPAPGTDPRLAWTAGFTRGASECLKQGATNPVSLCLLAGWILAARYKNAVVLGGLSFGAPRRAEPKSSPSSSVRSASASNPAAAGGHGYLGVGLLAVTGALAQQDGIPYGEGVAVEKVVPGGPADGAGIQAGDVIVAYDGETVRDHAGLASIIRSTNPGTKARLRILRKGQARSVEVELVSSPSASEAHSSNRDDHSRSAPSTGADDFFKKLFDEPSGTSHASGGTGAGTPSDDQLRKGCGADLQSTLQAAPRGDAFSQDVLGHCYDAGIGVAHDVAEAFDWFRKAAEQGNADVELFLGSYYAFGVGRPADAAEGDKWFAKAAAQENPAAEFNLATAYAHGGGVGRDEVKAFHWYRECSVHGSGRAEYQVGLAYEDGVGVGKMATKALGWYRKAVRDSHDMRTRDMAREGIRRVAPLGSGEAPPND